MAFPCFFIRWLLPFHLIPPFIFRQQSVLDGAMVDCETGTRLFPCAERGLNTDVSFSNLSLDRPDVLQ